MQGKLFKDLSASSAQVILNQLLGLAIFYATSLYLSKEIFGELNWVLAISSLLISVIGLGTELIVVKKIAAGQKLKDILDLQLVHVFISGFILLIALAFFYFFIFRASGNYFLLTGIVASQIISYLSSPFRQAATGMRAFIRLSIITITPNLIKLLSLLVYINSDTLSVSNLVLLFIITSVAELVLSVLITTYNKNITLFPFYWNKTKYRELITESFPQYGVVLFNIVLSRFDWILLGFLTTNVITADYSFSYKVFELCRLPLLILSPVLLPVFSNIFNNTAITLKKKTQLRLLYRTELVVAAILPLMLVSCWSYLFDMLTDGKYGDANNTTFMILALCLPIQFATDYCWNYFFARNKTRLTLKIALLSGLLNMLLNFILIPLFGGVGAAIAYLSSFVLQAVLFLYYSRNEIIKPDVYTLVTVIISSIVSIIAVRSAMLHPLLAPFAAIIIYISLCTLLRVIIPAKTIFSLKLLLNIKK
jgi:O-antigen/teichoic acid export membrane protein